ncbi:MAG TPA: mechanosensitive ion channel domain-containing protein, partial [Coriobacteriia bacterium]
DRLPAVVAAAIVLLAAWLIGRLTYAGVRRVLARTSTSGHVDVLVARFARAAVLTAGVVVALGVVGINVGALVASVGLVSLTIGFALKDVLANYFAGVMLLLQGPFKVGDTIVVESIEGVVADVTARDTVLRGADGRHVHVPNSKMFGSTVVNVTVEPVRRFELAFTLPAEADLASARGVILAAVSDAGGVLPDPGPDAQVTRVGATYARIAAHGWVDTREHSIGDVQGAAFVRASHRLHEAGVGAVRLPR